MPPSDAVNALAKTEAIRAMTAKPKRLREMPDVATMVMTAFFSWVET